MLTSYPTMFNSTQIPKPDSWEETVEKVVNNFQTESGHRATIVVRSHRLKASGTWTVSSKWLKTFQEFLILNSFTMKLYTAIDQARDDYTVSIQEDSFRYELIKGSERVAGTDGLYRLSFDIEEF